MSELRLGFFTDFTDPTLLLSGTAPAMLKLSNALEEFLGSGRAELPVHELASVSQKHPARLYVMRAPAQRPDAFCWSCSEANFQEVREMLVTLANGETGHQYFDLVDASADLVVSVGEYSDQWWREHG
jgi:hypothetical protein